jgi:[protein-PII] uridylyltransferase
VEGMQFDIGMTRDHLRDAKSRMALGLSTSLSPKELLRQHSDMVDELVRKAFRKAQSAASDSSVCLIAVGGYGRAELAPYSDIDLLLLYAPSNKSDLSPLISGILYPLWDLGLDVSCSSRSIPDCLKMAQSDLQVKTSLIDARYLDGEYEFFRSLYSLFSKKILHRNVNAFAATLMGELRQRHQKYEVPEYVLEPNLKEGEGGLRDFQMGCWIVRAKYKTDRWESILFPDHSRTLEKGVDFVWALRNQLHFLSGRRQDDLTFELQEQIAPVLGFPAGPTGIEEMMRQYHISARGILNFSEGLLERAISEPSGFKRGLSYFKRQGIDEHFGIRNGELRLLDPVLFKRDPSQLMTLFAHCQTYKVRMDFRTEEAVLEALHFIDDRFRQNESVNQTFLSILRKGEGMKAVLEKMHELGFLTHYLPEFSEIEGRVHYDLYHVHPVDVHSLLALEEMERLWIGDYQDPYPLLTSLIREIEKPEILYLTALLHDIGKGKEGNHSITGKEIVKVIAKRMGLSPEDMSLMEFLVSRHLFMIETASRRDLHDEGALMQFAGEAETLTQLKMLYLLTFADIKAVGPEAWTHWKDSLLTELFLKTSRVLEKEKGQPPSLKKDDILKKLEELLPPGVAAQYVEDLPSRYLSCFSWKEIVEHIQLARSLEKEPLFVTWEIDEGSRARVTTCTKNHYGLFFKIAGSMFVNRLNILEAQIHTWGNGVALDTFRVEDSTGEAERHLRQFKNDLQSVLSGDRSLKDLLSQRKESNGLKKKVIPAVAPEVTVNNQASDFHTLIEISAEDRMGILYEITQALTDHGCDIHFARISTLGNRILDVFYVQDTLGEKLEGKEGIDHLRESLLRLLTPR